MCHQATKSTTILLFSHFNVPGTEQEEDPEGDGTRTDDPAGRVHPGLGAQAAADAPEAAHRTHAAAAPDGA